MAWVSKCVLDWITWKPVKVSQLKQKVTALVLPSTPDVLSLGRRIEKHGYSFQWLHGKSPVLWTPEGTEIVLDV